MTAGDNVKLGYGQGRFVLGYGPGGVFGHVALVLKRMSMPGEVSVEWAVEGTIPEEARRQVEQAALAYLSGYRAVHSIPLRAMIIHVDSDPERRNDYERAVKLAMHAALQEMSLPVPQIYTAPEDESS
jgi:hypothetical protein